MTRAIVTAWHKYQPYGGEYYELLLDFYLQQMKKFESEYDKIYLLDSNWEIDPKKIEGMKAEIVRVSPHDRYYDVYKKFLPEVKEDLVLFMDDDMVVYKPDKIAATFRRLVKTHLLKDIDYNLKTGEIKYTAPGHGWDVVSIIDQIGTYETDKLKNGNKFCPYWFATRKDLLMKYDFLDWGPDMPYCETLGHLTEFMLANDVKPFGWEEDKSSLLFDGTEMYPNGTGKGKDLGYYHIRAGSVPAILLAYKQNDPDKYWEYLKNQPKSEYLRQCAWWYYMCAQTKNPVGSELYSLLNDCGANDPKGESTEWIDYMQKFKEYHGL